MPYKVRWTASAAADLESAADFLAGKSVEAAFELVADARGMAASLSTFAERGHEVPDLPGEPFRERPVRGHRLIYEVLGMDVHVLGFIHGRRDFLGAWESRERG
ncbi:MAG TPA: type II toxin-antitoxin system RelE/ParE family toxin [Longimicrobiaceae bacterium]|nr:type II toxin-antitoxin system RelE/ParE family toxin [Longimicrobiaceae bacterium]